MTWLTSTLSEQAWSRMNAQFAASTAAEPVKPTKPELTLTAVVASAVAAAAAAQREGESIELKGAPLISLRPIPTRPFLLYLSTD